MAKAVRQVIKIDEELCNGCGLCVPSCAEGALQIVDGKAKLVADRYCDGLGACLGECPQGALSFESREAEDFDEAAAMEHVRAMGREPEPHEHHHHHAHQGHHNHQPAVDAHKHGGFVCPSARTIDRTREPMAQETPAAQGTVASELRQWPVKLYLVNPNAPYFQDADLLVAADCVPFAYGGLHPDFMRGKVVVTGCPKFDDTSLYFEKLSEIVRVNNIRSVTVLKMEVPCCGGMFRIADAAVVASGKDIPVKSVTISMTGEIRDEAQVGV